MIVQAHPETARGSALASPELRLVQTRRHRARLHLFTYVVGNALFWALWGAISVSADHWYWWPVVPLAGWTLVLGLHLRHVYRSVSR
jgi:hypothetical protein